MAKYNSVGRNGQRIHAATNTCEACSTEMGAVDEALANAKAFGRQPGW